MSTGRLDGKKHKYLISHAVNILRILGFPQIVPYFRLGSREVDLFACRSYGKPIFIECIVSEKPKQVIQKIQLIQTSKPPKEYIDNYLEVFGVS